MGDGDAFSQLFCRGSESVWLGRDSACWGKASLALSAVTDERGYNWLELNGRQLCWAHIKRDFTRIAERTGVSGELGKALLEQQRLLFEQWYRVRDGTLSSNGISH